MDAADRVVGGDYATCVGDTGSRQLGRLTDAFNQMVERPDERGRRASFAESRTSLHTAAGDPRDRVEGMPRRAHPAEPERLRPLLDETIVMARLLDDLRTLSMADAGVLPLHRETLDPRVLADEAAQTFRSMAHAADVALASVHADDVPASIEADLAGRGGSPEPRCVNAIRHTPPGGAVTVRVAGTGRRRRVRGRGHGGWVSGPIGCRSCSTGSSRRPMPGDRSGPRDREAARAGPRRVDRRGRPATGGTRIRCVIPFALQNCHVEPARPTTQHGRSWLLYAAWWAHDVVGSAARGGAGSVGRILADRRRAAHPQLRPPRTRGRRDGGRLGAQERGGPPSCARQHLRPGGP